MNNEFLTLTDKVGHKMNLVLNEFIANKDILSNYDKNSTFETFVIYKIATLSTLIEEQNRTINQLTETISKIVDNV